MNTFITVNFYFICLDIILIVIVKHGPPDISLLFHFEKLSKGFCWPQILGNLPSFITRSFEVPNFFALFEGPFEVSAHI